MREASSVSGLPDLLRLNISLTNFFIYLEVVVNTGILKNIYLKTIPNYASFPQHMGHEDFKIWISFLVHTFSIGHQIPPIFCFRKIFHGCIIIFYLVDYFSDLPHLHRVEPFI